MWWCRSQGGRSCCPEGYSAAPGAVKDQATGTHAMDSTQSLRDHLRKLLDWHDAHADFDAAVKGMPPHLAGVRPAGLPYSPWELLEHLRLCQRDILDFCRDPDYAEKN